MKYRILPALIAGLVTAAAVLMVSSGCATPPEEEERPGDPQMLEQEAREFHSNLRWARYDHAVESVHEAYRGSFEGRFEERGDDYEIVDMETRTIDMVDEGREALVEVDQQWYELPSTVVESERFVERWVYEDDRWQLRERMQRSDYRDQGETFDSERAADEQQSDTQR